MIKMPKLLDFIKEKEITHAEAMELIEKYFVKRELETDEVKEPEVDADKIDKTEDKIDDQKIEKDEEDDIEALVQKLADEEEAKIEAKIESDKVKIALMVQEELKKRGKVVRKTPSKGKITETPQLNYDININGYEVKTIKKKK